LFWAPRATEGQPLGNDLVAFACALAVAGLSAAAVAFVISGEKKLAREVFVAISIATAVSLATGYVLLWVDPSVVRGQMDAWSFLRLRADSAHWAEAVLLFVTPFAAGVGVVVGLITGLLFRTAVWSRRNATVLALGLLAICAIEPLRESLFGFVAGWGWTLHVVFRSSWIGAIEISATAAVMGSLAGSSIACLVIYLTRRMRRPGAESESAR
jgi:hypothetical protein